jgi:hypothetical protein
VLKYFHFPFGKHRAQRPTIGLNLRTNVYEDFEFQRLDNKFVCFQTRSQLINDRYFSWQIANHSPKAQHQDLLQWHRLAAFILSEEARKKVKKRFHYDGS